MARGGKRTGAGALRGNLNSLKKGGYFQQLRHTLYGNTPEEWHEFLSRLKDDQFRARANMSAILLWIRAGFHEE